MTSTLIYQGLFAEIAGLAELHFGHDISVEYSDERHQGLLVTVDAAVLLDRPQVEKQDRWEGLVNPVDKSITDLLGDYLPETRNVIIYREVCESTAEQFAIPYDVLEYLVALHEITHAVTHLGEEGFSGSGIIWEFYPHADLWDRELFAQVYPLFHLVKNNDQVALDAFRTLSLNQLAIYNSWQIYQQIPLKKINELLRLTRLKRFCAWIDLDDPTSARPP